MSLLSVHIEEVTAVADLCADVPLAKLCDLGKAGIDTENSRGAVYRIKELHAVAIIFPTGKIICTGARSVRDAEEAIRRTLEMVRGIGTEVPSNIEVKIEKIVAAFRLAEGLDLAKVASSLEGASYDPANFPAVVYPDKETSSVFLLKADGKVICAGAKSMKDIQASFRKLQERLEASGIRAELP